MVFYKHKLSGGTFTQPFFHTFWDFSRVIFKHCTEWLQWSWRSYSVITTRLTRFSIFWHLQKSGWEMEALFCRQAANKSQENEGIQFLSSRRTLKNLIFLWLNFSILRYKIMYRISWNELLVSKNKSIVIFKHCETVRKKRKSTYIGGFWGFGATVTWVTKVSEYRLCEGRWGVISLIGTWMGSCPLTRSRSLFQDWRNKFWVYKKNLHVI